MTTSAPSIKFSHTDTASFKAWAQAVGTALVAVGLVKTADTGQVDWEAFSWASSTDSDQGFEVYRFSDTLQSTKPVFLKVVYGNGSPSSSARMYFQIGTGTNGAGALTGVWTTVVQATSAAADGTCTAYFSGDTSSLCLCFPRTSGGTVSAYIALVVDRTRGSDGTANGDGLYWCSYSTYSGGQQYAGYFNFAAQAAAAINPAAPNMTGVATGKYGSDVVLMPHVVAVPKAEAFALACLSYWGADISRGSEISLTHLGASHTFLCLGSFFPGADGVKTAGVSLAMRYE